MSSTTSATKYLECLTCEARFGYDSGAERHADLNPGHDVRFSYRYYQAEERAAAPPEQHHDQPMDDDGNYICDW